VDDLPSSTFDTCAPRIASTPRSRNSDPVHSSLVVWKPCWSKTSRRRRSRRARPRWSGRPPARSRTPASRSSWSTLKTYSKAAPSHVQVPWPIPTTRVCGCRRRASLDDLPQLVRPRRRGRRCTRSVWPSGPRPGGGLEVQLRAGGVDQVVVAEPLGGAGLVGGGVARCRPRPEGRRRRPRGGSRGLGLPEVDALARVDRRQREDHVFLAISPTPTQMLDGIQFHWEFGETTVTSCSRPSSGAGAVPRCDPETPPSMTTSARTPSDAIAVLERTPGGTRGAAKGDRLGTIGLVYPYGVYCTTHEDSHHQWPTTAAGCATLTAGTAPGPGSDPPRGRGGTASPSPRGARRTSASRRTEVRTFVQPHHQGARSAPGPLGPGERRDRTLTKPSHSEAGTLHAGWLDWVSSPSTEGIRQ
jgi:hypothetical protein